MKKKLFVVLALFGSMTASGQRSAVLPDDTLAHVGSTVITARELIQRLELLPFPGSVTGSADEIKRKALLALIAEKLLGREASRLDLRNDDDALRTDRELENLFVRDALFKEEVSSKVVVSEDEIHEGMRRLPFEFQVLSFLVRDRTAGNKLVARLRKAKPGSVLDSVQAGMFTQVDTIRLRFGAPDVAYEEAVFSIGRDRISAPFESPNFGWAVLYLIDRLPIKDIQKMNVDERRHRVTRILRERKEEVVAAEVYYNILMSKRATADRRIFMILADSLSEFWKQDTARFKRRDSYILTSDMAEVLMHRLAPFADSILVHFDAGGLTLGQALEMLRYEDYLSREYVGERFLHDLSEEIKSLAAREILAREGRQRGLLERPSVGNDLSQWRTYLNAGALYRKVRDSVQVSDDDIFDHLLKNKEYFGYHYEVNVREVLCLSESDVNEVLQQLSKGTSLQELAPGKSIRPVWAARGGESGFFPLIDHPEIGFRAMLADSGKLVGPIRLNEGFSIFTVLGKRGTDKALTPFDSLRHNTGERLLAEKRKRAMDKTIAALAREEQVAINYGKLKDVKVTLIQTFTRRHMGFGGRMTAVPLLMQQWDWIKEYEPAEQLP